MCTAFLERGEGVISLIFLGGEGGGGVSLQSEVFRMRIFRLGEP